MTDTALPEPGSKSAFYIVDISSYIFRAYYAIGPLTTSSGTATNAVFGVTRMLQALWKEHKPEYLAVAMDSRTPTWRKLEYAEYKANRPPPPPDLKEQFPLVREVVEGFAIPVLQRDGFEADDIIATAAKRAKAAGLTTIIVTGDKDLMQLVDDEVLVYDTMKNKVFGAKEVEKKHGVRPDQLGDYLALVGDSSDNVPGVPKVGPKTACKVLAEHDTLEAVLAAAPNIKGKLGENLVNHVEDARLSRHLVSLREDVEIDFQLEELRFGDPDVPKLRELFTRLEFWRLVAELGDDETEEGDDSAPERRYETIASRRQLDEALEAIEKVGAVSLDLETTSLDPVRAEIVGIALSWEPHVGYYVPVAHRDEASTQLPLEDVLDALRPLLEDGKVKVYGQNFKYDDIILRRNGLHVAHVAFDTMMASYLIDADKREHNLDRLAGDLLGYKAMSYNEVTDKKRGSQLSFDEVSVDKATRYAAEDAEVVFTLVQKMEPIVDDSGFGPLLRDIELPLGRVLATMELRGVLVDTELLETQSRQVGTTLAVLEAKAHEAAGRSFNVNSPLQLAVILFDEIGLEPVKKTKGRTGRSTDVEVLTELSDAHPLPAIILEHRGLAKLKGTYLDGLPKLVNPQTGRIHTSYNQAVAATGRLSSSNPNLQNIPVRTELGREIRRAFTAPEGSRLLSADYSQIELRVLAHLSGDPLLTESFNAGEDVHERTAREVLGLGADEPVDRELRRRAKAINFGVIYGKTDYGLAKELGISHHEAVAFKKDYFDRYAGVASFMDDVIEQAKGVDGVRTLAGRRRRLPEINARNPARRAAAERMARNTPIQGTAADIMKIAMIRIAERLEREKLDASMVLTVHDEVVLEVARDCEESVEAVVREEMERAAELDVPLVVDAGWGDCWADAH